MPRTTSAGIVAAERNSRPFQAAASDDSVRSAATAIDLSWQATFSGQAPEKPNRLLLLDRRSSEHGDLNPALGSPTAKPNSLGADLETGIGVAFHAREQRARHI